MMLYNIELFRWCLAFGKLLFAQFVRVFLCNFYRLSHFNRPNHGKWMMRFSPVPKEQKCIAPVVTRPVGWISWTSIPVVDLFQEIFQVQLCQIVTCRQMSITIWIQRSSTSCVASLQADVATNCIFFCHHIVVFVTMDCVICTHTRFGNIYDKCWSSDDATCNVE